MESDSAPICITSPAHEPKVLISTDIRKSIYTTAIKHILFDPFQNREGITELLCPRFYTSPANIPSKQTSVSPPHHNSSKPQSRWPEPPLRNITAKRLIQYDANFNDQNKWHSEKATWPRLILELNNAESSHLQVMSRPGVWQPFLYSKNLPPSLPFLLFWLYTFFSALYILIPSSHTKPTTHTAPRQTTNPVLNTLHSHAKAKQSNASLHLIFLQKSIAHPHHHQ